MPIPRIYGASDRLLLPRVRNMMDYGVETAARTIWAEARGEPEDGQRAVAHVLVNRLRDGRWGKTLTEVCWARKQFSCWNDGDPNKMKIAALSDADPLLAKFAGFVLEALHNDSPDITQGARWYHATSIPPPDWALGRSFVQIGHHRFFKDVN